MRGASESPRPRGHPGRGVGAPGRGVQRAVRTEPTARAPRACAPRCGCGTRRPWARLRSTRAPCGADRTPPPGLRGPVRPGAGAVRAGRGRGSGPHAHHVMRTGPLRLRSACPSARVRVRCASRHAAPAADCGPHATYVVGAGPLCLRSACPGAGAGAVRRRCAAIRAGPAGGSGPRAHHVVRTGPLRLRSTCPSARVRVRYAQAVRAAPVHTRTMCSGVSRHAWGAVSLLGVRRDVGTGAGPDVPRAAAAAAPGCARCAATAPSPSSGGHRQRPSFPWTPVRAPRWAQAGRRRARHAPRAAAAPGPGACRQRRGEGGAVLGRCAVASARVSASRRAGGGSTRR